MMVIIGTNANSKDNDNDDNNATTVIIILITITYDICYYITLNYTRQRLVCKTLCAVDDMFDPAQGLERAARALAEEMLARPTRQPAEQMAACAAMAQQPRRRGAAEVVEEPAGPQRTWAEQRARCEELTQAFDRPEPESPKGPRRCESEQKLRMAELSRPRPPRAGTFDPEQASTAAQPWRELLGARASAVEPEEVE